MGMREFMFKVHKTQEILTLKLDDNSNVAAAVDQLADKLEVSSDDIRLLFAGKNPRPERTLSSLGVPNKGKITVYIKDNNPLLLESIYSNKICSFKTPIFLSVDSESSDIKKLSNEIVTDSKISDVIKPLIGKQSLEDFIYDIEVTKFLGNKETGKNLDGQLLWSDLNDSDGSFKSIAEETLNINDIDSSEERERLDFNKVKFKITLYKNPFANPIPLSINFASTVTDIPDISKTNTKEILNTVNERLPLNLTTNEIAYLYNLRIQIKDKNQKALNPPQNLLLTRKNFNKYLSDCATGKDLAEYLIYKKFKKEPGLNIKEIGNICIFIDVSRKQQGNPLKYLTLAVSNKIEDASSEITINRPILKNDNFKDDDLGDIVKKLKPPKHFPSHLIVLIPSSISTNETVDLENFKIFSVKHSTIMFDQPIESIALKIKELAKVTVESWSLCFLNINSREQYNRILGNIDTKFKINFI